MSSFDSERSSTDATEIQFQSTSSTLVTSIGTVISKLLIQNEKLPNYQKIVKSQSKMIFSASEVPEITIDDYLARISFYSKAEDSTFIIALIYIDRICANSSIMITEYNVHRILFTSILIGIKYNEDQYFDNNYYGQIAGVPMKELCYLESELLRVIEFNLYIKKIIKIYNMLKNYTLVSIIMDFKNRLGYKDAPIDKGREVWEKLYNEREIINDERELEELLIDT